MKKLSIVCLAVVMAVVFGYGSAFAATAKATAKCGEVYAVPSDGVWTDILDPMYIHVPQGNEVFIDVALECGLTTDTTVLSRALAKAVADAEAVVKIRVLVDGMVAAPGYEEIYDEISGELLDDGGIIFARRHQTLIAKFAGADTDEDGTVDTDEMLRLILDTMNANSFNFISANLDQGTYTIKVQAKLEYTKTAGYPLGDPGIDPATTSGAATAYMGRGSVTVECVRMIENDPYLQ